MAIPLRSIATSELGRCVPRVQIGALAAPSSWMVWRPRTTGDTGSTGGVLWT